MGAKGRRYAYIDVLGIAASFAVVMLHLNYCVWQGPAGPAWRSAILIETLFFWPVPVFFMISGATLMDYRTRMDTREYFRRRFWRTVVPWLAWSVLGLAYRVAATRWFGWDMPYLGPRTVFNDIVETRYVDFYWFFPVLFSIYLAIPVLSDLAHRERAFDYLIALSMAFSGILPLVSDLTGLSAMGSFAPQVATGYAVFPLIGYKLSRWQPTRRQRLGIYAAGIVGWLVQLVGTVMLSTPETGVSMVFKSGYGPCVIAQAVAVFVAARSVDYEAIERRVPGFAQKASWLSSLTFGIYLSHWFVLKTVQGTLSLDPHTLAFRVGGAIAIYAFCAALTAVLKRIPGVRRIVP